MLMNTLIQLGLDLDSGESPIIYVNDIESLSKKKITGNGSVIRRDKEPYLYFNFTTIKHKNAIIGFKFNGYKKVKDVITYLQEINQNSFKRILREKEKIAKRNEELRELMSLNLEEQIYSKQDINQFID